MQYLSGGFSIWLGWTIASAILLATGLWYFYPAAERPGLPPQRRRAIPWTGFQLLLTLYLVELCWPYLFLILVQVSGLPLGESELGNIRKGVLADALAFPFRVLTVPLLLYALSATRPYQLGLTTSHAAEFSRAGALGALLFMPFVYAVQFATDYLYRQLVTGSPPHHPLEALARTEPWLIIIPAVIVAPIREELAFRGLLQQWLSRRSWGGDVGMIGIFLWVFVRQEGQLERAFHESDWPGLWLGLAPLLFILAMVPAFLLLRLWWRSPVACAIYAVSLVFASVHTTWPQPIPLFILALGLGMLAYRTQSLVGPVVMHTVFNGFPCLYFLFNRG